jgi:hypothetical protein
MSSASAPRASPSPAPSAAKRRRTAPAPDLDADEARLRIQRSVRPSVRPFAFPLPPFFARRERANSAWTCARLAVSILWLANFTTEDAAIWTEPHGFPPAVLLVALFHDHHNRHDQPPAKDASFLQLDALLLNLHQFGLLHASSSHPLPSNQLLALVALRIARFTFTLPEHAAHATAALRSILARADTDTGLLDTTIDGVCLLVHLLSLASAPLLLLDFLHLAARKTKLAAIRAIFTPTAPSPSHSPLLQDALLDDLCIDADYDSDSDSIINDLMRIPPTAHSAHSAHSKPPLILLLAALTPSNLLHVLYRFRDSDGSPLLHACASSPDPFRFIQYFVQSMPPQPPSISNSNASEPDIARPLYAPNQPSADTPLHLLAHIPDHLHASLLRDSTWDSILQLRPDCAFKAICAQNTARLTPVDIALHASNHSLALKLLRFVFDLTATETARLDSIVSQCRLIALLTHTHIDPFLLLAAQARDTLLHFLTHTLATVHALPHSAHHLDSVVRFLHSSLSDPAHTIALLASPLLAPFLLLTPTPETPFDFVSFIPTFARSTATPLPTPPPADSHCLPAAFTAACSYTHPFGLDFRSDCTPAQAAPIGTYCADAIANNRPISTFGNLPHRISTALIAALLPTTRTPPSTSTSTSTSLPPPSTNTLAIHAARAAFVAFFPNENIPKAICNVFTIHDLQLHINGTCDSLCLDSPSTSNFPLALAVACQS